MSETLRDLTARIVGAIVDVLRGLDTLIADESSAQAWLVSRGWKLPTGSALTALQSALPTDADIQRLTSDLQTLVLGDTPDLSAIATLAGEAAKLLSDIRSAATAVSGLPTPLDNPDVWTEFADSLVIGYLEQYQPGIAAALRLLGVIYSQAVAADGGDRESDAMVEVLALDQLATVFGTPAQILTTAYGWPQSLDQDAVLEAALTAARTVGFTASIVPPLEEMYSKYWPNGDPDGAAALEAIVYERRDPDTGYARLAVQIVPIPERSNPSGPMGVWIGAYGDATLATSLPLSGDVTLTLTGSDANAIAPGIELLPSGPGLSSDSSTGTYDVGLQLAIEPPTPWRPLGAASGLRVEIDDLMLALELTGSGSSSAKPEVKLRVGTSKLEVTLDFSDADSFLATILPTTPQTLDASGSLIWSSRTGLTFEGEGELTLSFPLSQDLGPLHLTNLTVGVGLDPDLALSAAIDVGVALGPISASVQQIGLKALTTTPDSPDAIVSFDKLGLGLGFRPPDGAGLGIEAGPIGGGGFLSFDQTQQQYAGVLELLVPSLSLTAVGLITTKMPDGSSGFSMLVIISASLPPVQLGFGFTLNKIGGLLGVNRGMNTDALQAGLKSGTLDSIQFPQNVVPNAPKIINDVETVFPVAVDTYVFGPMVELGWGTPSLVTLDIGLILELPSPLRLVILGKLAAALPIFEDPLVLLQIEVLGIFDFDARTISIDGTLADSRVVTFPITGEMALRASYGDSPTLAMSAGGFNPRFQPPPSFPSLDRLAIALADGNNPRLRLEAYFAVTSNTVQGGAKLDLYVSKHIAIAGTFSVAGELSFDALIRLAPFQIIVDLNAQLEVQRNGDDFCSVALSLTLSGPRPWNGAGEAKVHVLGSDHSISIDVQVGPTDPPPSLPPANPLNDLEGALTTASNWSAQLPSGSGAMVSLANLVPGANGSDPSSPLVLHPCGQATVRQRAVPLNQQIATYGHQPIDSGPTSFAVTVTPSGAGDATNATVQDLFAPGDFFALTDDQKLSGPGYEEMDSGVSVGSGELASEGPIGKDFGYTTVVFDIAAPSNPPNPLPPTKISAAAAAALARAGSAARAAVRTQGDGRFAAPGKPIGLAAPGYALASTSTLAAVGTQGTYTQMSAARSAAQAADPTHASGYQIVGANEVLA